MSDHYQRLVTSVQRVSCYLDLITSNLHTNPKPFWNWIKRVRNGITRIPNVFYRGQSLSKVADKANALNHYFTSVFTKENTTQLNSLRNTTTSTRHPTSIEVVKVDEDEVYKINPSKLCGPDNIPGRILTEAAPEIHEPLTKIFNMSMRTPQRLDQSQCYTDPQKRLKTSTIEL